MQSASPASQGLLANIGLYKGVSMIDKTLIAYDIVCAVLATLFIYIGLTNDGLLSKLALLWGGVLAGYIITTYLNWEAV
jgi:hypothetical protein